jgi:hypothetical protein
MRTWTGCRGRRSEKEERPLKTFPREPKTGRFLEIALPPAHSRNTVPDSEKRLKHAKREEAKGKARGGMKKRKQNNVSLLLSVRLSICPIKGDLFKSQNFLNCV